MNFYFWQRWLFIVSILLLVFGLALAFFNQSPFFDFLFNHQVNPVFWKSMPLNENTSAFQHWAYGVLGATVAGWGVFLAFITHYPFRRKEAWAWNCLVLGVSLWYVVDTSLSYLSHVIFNMAFNTVLVLLLVPPLAFTRTFFFKENH